MGEFVQQLRRLKSTFTMDRRGSQPPSFGSFSAESDEEDGLVGSGSDDDLLEEDYYAGANPLSAFFNVSNCAIGAGVLSLPYAYQTLGVGLGLVIYLIMAVAAWYGLHILIQVSLSIDKTSYIHCVKQVLGKPACLGVQLLIVAYTFGTCTGYLIIVGDLLPRLLTQWVYDTTTHRPFMSFAVDPLFLQALVSLFVVLPLAMLKRMDSLKYVSVFAMTSILFFTGVVIVHSSKDMVELGSKEINSKLVWAQGNSAIFLGIPIIAFALGGHLQSIGIFSELKPKYRNGATWNRTAIAVVIFLSIIYLIVGIMGYLRFLPGTSGNILEKMIEKDSSDTMVQACAMAMIIVVIFSYPLVSWPMRKSIDTLLFCDRPFAAWRHILETLTIVISTFLVAVLIGDIKVVFGLTGAIGAVLIKFVIPALLYLGVGGALNKQDGEPALTLSIWQKVCAWLLVIVGVLTGVVSTAVVILEAVGVDLA